jgi:hypothetical protein
MLFKSLGLRSNFLVNEKRRHRFNAALPNLFRKYRGHDAACCLP